MRHVRQPQVLHVRDTARNLRRNVHALHRRTHHDKRVRVLRLRLRLSGHMQRLTRDELAILRSVPVLRDDLPAPRFQLCRIEVPAARGRGDQNLAHLRGGVANRGPAVLNRMTARRVAFVRCAARVGGDELNVQGQHFQLFRRDLNQRRLDALTELRFAGEHRDRAVRVDANPRVEVRRGLQASR